MKTGLVALGVIGLILTGFLGIFIASTMSETVWDWDGYNKGNPTGQTITVASEVFKPDNFAICVGKAYVYDTEDHDFGTVNFTEMDTGKNYSITYDISPGTLQGYVWDGGILALPPGVYTITALNTNSKSGKDDNVEWKVIHAGYFRYTGSVTGDIPDNVEGWALFIFVVGILVQGMGSIYALIKGRQDGYGF
ncbi:MAG TPA: hypothetical protein VKK79_18635 [Candidatus Lokiarchaeia archaeon]|nr:hypothetical protein [Candidatus Lokiarchaeia archaeon]